MSDEYRAVEVKQSDSAPEADWPDHEASTCGISESTAGFVVEVRSRDVDGEVGL